MMKAPLQYRQCETYPDYEISEFGELRRIDDGLHIKGSPDKDGYVRFGVLYAGKRRLVSAARMVIEAFIGPSPFKGAQVCHNDGSRNNNHYSNLRWDSVKGNAADRRIHGTATIGSYNGQSKLNEASVVAIRAAYKAGKTQRQLAVEYGIGSGRMSEVVNGKSWSHVPL